MHHQRIHHTFTCPFMSALLYIAWYSIKRENELNDDPDKVRFRFIFIFQCIHISFVQRQLLIIKTSANRKDFRYEICAWIYSKHFWFPFFFSSFAFWFMHSVRLCLRHSSFFPIEGICWMMVMCEEWTVNSESSTRNNIKEVMSVSHYV